MNRMLGLLVMVVAGIPVDAQLGPEVPTHDTGANIGRFAIIGGMGISRQLNDSSDASISIGLLSVPEPWRIGKHYLPSVTMRRR
jgi:hypothetical protein